VAGEHAGPVCVGMGVSDIPHQVEQAETGGPAAASTDLQRDPTIGTVITVADNEQDDVEIDSD